MIFTTCLMIYAGLSYAQSTSFRVALGSALVGLCVFITVYYHYLQDPTFHQNTYALLTAFIVFRSMYIMEYTLRPSLRKTEDKHMLERQQASGQSFTAETTVNEDQRRQNHRDSEILKQMWILVAFGLSVFLLGFGIWALDNVFCSTLRSWRRNVGLPWGIILEGHGWWLVEFSQLRLRNSGIHFICADTLARHLMTGLGAYCYIVWGIWLRHCLNGRQDEYRLSWPAFYRLPEIVAIQSQLIDTGRAQRTSRRKVA